MNDNAPPAAARPFVDRPVVDIESASGAAHAAADRWGLRISREPSRVGMNALFLGDSCVVRVGHTTVPAAAGCEFHLTLLDAGIPVVRPLFSGNGSGTGTGTGMNTDSGTDRVAARVADGHGAGDRGVELAAADIGAFGATGWERVREVRRAINFATVGAAIRRLHELSPAKVPDSYPLPSPLDFPWWQLAPMLERAPLVDAATRQNLRHEFERWSPLMTQINTDQVVCHGDLHPNNVLNAAAGPLLVDWDLACWSNPAWDHAMMLSVSRRWGGDPRSYEAFAAGYGRSFADDPLANAIASLRDVVATLLLANAVDAGTGNRDELEVRLGYWRHRDPTVRFTAQ